MEKKCKYCNSEKIVYEKRSSNYYSLDKKETLHGNQVELYTCLNCSAEEWDLGRLVEEEQN